MKARSLLPCQWPRGYQRHGALAPGGMGPRIPRPAAHSMGCQCRRVAVATGCTLTPGDYSSECGWSSRKVKRRLLSGVQAGSIPAVPACFRWAPGSAHWRPGARGLPPSGGLLSTSAACVLAFMYCLSDPWSLRGHTHLSLCAGHWARCWDVRGRKRGAFFQELTVFQQVQGSRLARPRRLPGGGCV